MQQAQAANLIVNGDFEEAAAAFVQPSPNNGGSGDFATFFDAIGPILEGSWHQDALSGAGGSRLLKGDSFTVPGIQAPPGPNTGQQWLYLTEAGQPDSQVSQTVMLAQGSYALSFALSSWSVGAGGGGSVRVHMSDGTHSVLSEVFVASPSIWSSFDRPIEIVVPGAYTLSFLVLTRGFPALDSVQLTSPIPEPKSYVLMLAAIGLLGWGARRVEGR